ncbi:hypothetical protein GCM10022214_00630 [Actinomadura miaoliensis]|uniref:Insertion element IS402-like domain-containing protein n=1 Tax=Actinomadura miaoliensis TaxID=430685 RepID=A0ABP7UVT4_9ACTN
MTDTEWELIEPHLPLGASGPIPDLRAQSNAVMWRFRTGSPWRDVPAEYGNWSTMAVPGVRVWTGRAVRGAAVAALTAGLAGGLVGVAGARHAAAAAAPAASPVVASAAAGPTVVGPTPRGARQQVGLWEAIAQLPVAAERRDGYTRDKLRHWGGEDGDGCNTRNEVLLDEATRTPQIGPGCRLSGGQAGPPTTTMSTSTRPPGSTSTTWSREAGDSGAYTWDAGRRQRYANDLGDPRALGVTPHLGLQPMG